MEAALLLLLLQGILGALDTLYYHEFRLQLPGLVTARTELKLHAARDVLYAVIFGSLAWFSWEGVLAWVLVAVLSAEVLITIWDFVEEDRSRKLPAGERGMHAVMGLVYGGFLTTLLPQALNWASLPTGYRFHYFGLLSWLLSAMAVGVFLSGVRDTMAAEKSMAARKVAANPAL